MLRAANLGLRFFLELCILAALGYWGFQTGDSAPLKVILGIGAPLIAAVLWGVFISPKASVRLPGFARLLLEYAIFGAAALALAAAGQPELAAVFFAAAVISGVYNYFTDPRQKASR